MILNFIKMNGCGNDFMIVDLRQNEDLLGILTKQKIIELADYKKSVGFDQLLLISNSNQADISLKIFNSDGSEVEACGNGTRCAADFIMNNQTHLKIATKNRVLLAKKENDQIKINMGEAKIDTKIYSFGELNGFFVDIGNPHIVIDVSGFSNEDIDSLFHKYGSIIENDPRFPNKVNVNFVKILDRNTVNLRTWERGAGATLACGTGACASFALLNAKNVINNNSIIKQSGGDLIISIENNQIMMSGDTKINYQGTFKIR